jgi:hypothetical protein
MKPLLFALIITTVGSCRSADPIGSADQIGSMDLPFRTIARGNQFRIAGTGWEWAQDQAEWRDLWGRCMSAQPVRTEPPLINFESEMVVCVYTSGTAIEVERVVEDESELTLKVREQLLPKDESVARRDPHPFQIVALPRRSQYAGLSFVVHHD